MRNVFGSRSKSRARRARWRSFQSVSALGLAFGIVAMSPRMLGAAAVDTTRHPDSKSIRSVQTNDFGILVMAPDRGFLGNEETREAIRAGCGDAPTDIVFVTDDRTKQTLRQSLARMESQGIRRFTVAPLFLSAADPRLKLAETFLEDLTGDHSGGSSDSVIHGIPFGQTYFAVETLADRFREIQAPAGRKVVVIGYGARNGESRREMEGDLQRIADMAAQGFAFESVRASVWYDSSVPNAEAREAEMEAVLEEVARDGRSIAIVPFDLGKKLDSMMSFSASLRRRLPEGAEFFDGGVTPHPAVSDWIGREINRQIPVRPDNLGVVFLAHGSDFHWNETMRQAVNPLTDRYKIEFAFCMADQPLVERAVRRLEKRGARKIVIVRVFGLASSFQSNVDRMIGLDVERALAPSSSSDLSGHGAHQSPSAGHVRHDANHGQHDHHEHGAHGADGTDLPPPRIRSAAQMTTVGGLEDNRLFAEALLDRAKALSRNPERETVVLVAHGAGEDSTNDHWRRLLNSLADHMRANGGAEFRDIVIGTWREDWPEKRASNLAEIRRLVAEASRDEGRAIVIPARTTAQGNEREFLDGLHFDLGTGFAPHPLFVQWFESQIEAGVNTLSGGRLQLFERRMPYGGHGTSEN